MRLIHSNIKSSKEYKVMWYNGEYYKEQWPHTMTKHVKKMSTLVNGENINTGV